jgi:hypothetical protein
VEVGAGLGYWAAQLRGTGAVVAPIDVSPPAAHERWTAVARGTAAKLRRPAVRCHHTLLLCFPSPPEDDGTAYADGALTAFRGQRVCYVGEWATGMTASPAFHQRLLEDFMLQQRVPLPNWPQMCAELFVFERRGTTAPSPLPTPMVRCHGCGAGDDAVSLYRCPATRQVVACSEDCAHKTNDRRRAFLAAAHLEADPPPFPQWESVEFIDRLRHPARFAALRNLVPNEGRG